MTRNELLRKHSLLNTVELSKTQTEGLTRDIITEFDARALQLPIGTDLIRYNHFVKEFEDFFTGIDNKTSASLESVWKSVSHYITTVKSDRYPEIQAKKDAIFAMKNYELLAWFKENSNRDVLPFGIQDEKLNPDLFEKDDVVQFAVTIYNSRYVTFSLRKQGLSKAEIKYVKLVDKFATLIAKLSVKMNVRSACKNLGIDSPDGYTESELDTITNTLLETCDGKQVPFIITSNEYLKEQK